MSLQLKPFKIVQVRLRSVLHYNLKYNANITSDTNAMFTLATVTPVQGRMMAANVYVGITLGEGHLKAAPRVSSDARLPL